jgi:hypothetical protein
MPQCYKAKKSHDRNHNPDIVIKGNCCTASSAIFVITCSRVDCKSRTGSGCIICRGCTRSGFYIAGIGGSGVQGKAGKPCLIDTRGTICPCGVLTAPVPT